MNNDWLAKLAPEHAPAAPGWWPLALGWWVLAILIVVAVCLVMYWWLRPASRRRRFARNELRRLRERALDPADAARAIQSLLRRYALAVFGRDMTARLSGDAWLNFLADSGGEAFVGPPGRALLVAAYSDAASTASDLDRESWFKAADQFLRRARPMRRAAR